MRGKILILMLAFVLLGGGLHAQLHCAFTASQQFSCPPLVDTFTDQSTGSPTRYYWDFDNGSTSTLANPIQAFTTPGIYNVLHVVYNGTDSSVATMQIKVFQTSEDSFISYNNNGCANPCQTVNFLNMTVPGESPVVEYVWDFGDGSLADTGYNASHCYTQTGSYRVTLVSIDSNGCETNKVIPGFVNIKNPPSATLSASPTHSCTAPQTVNFTGSGSSPNGPVTYQLYYGNGSHSAQPNSSTTYNGGIFYPYLVVTDSFGCTAIDTDTVAITVVHAGFTTNAIQACNDVPVQFTDTSNFAASWYWQFGNGDTSTQQNPTETYTANGTYTVTLQVSYEGCSNTATEINYIHVTTPINIAFSAADSFSCTPPLNVQFTSSTPGATSVLWNFGDTDTSSQADPTHFYTSTGTYNVSLSATNASGCVNTQTHPATVVIGGLRAAFTMDSTQGCAPLKIKFTDSTTSNAPITSIKWIFGDGSTSTQTNPVYTYNNGGKYLPMLIVQNANGCIDTAFATDSILVGNTLQPNFTAQPLTQCVDQIVNFTNLTTGYTTNTEFIWHFGDGDTSESINPTHAYADTGQYNITLDVINQGCPSDTERIKYVLIVVPKANFIDSFDCSNPTHVIFVDQSIGADTWFWQFGDGTTSSVQNPPTHIYPATGTYTVLLIVTNATTGCVDSSKQQISIGNPAASFSADTTSGCEPLTIFFRDSSVLASSWLWNFGDSSTSNVQNPQHTYNSTGQYTVSLTINPGGGCANKIVKTNYITVYGVTAHFSATPSSGCAPLKVVFKDSSSSFMGSILFYKWKFGDGDTSIAQNPTYTYINGTHTFYNATLRVQDNHGCVALVNEVITPLATVPLFAADTNLCPGEVDHFMNMTQYAYSYLWQFGDGDTSALPNPTHAYTNPGTYTVTLISIMAPPQSCRDTLKKVAYVKVDTPQVNFYVSSNFKQCPPFPVQFYNTTTWSGLKYLWNFGDGDTSTTANPLHVYKFPGTFSVTLTGTDSFGCSGSKTYYDLITLQGPLGLFHVTPDVGCVPLTVTFSGTTQRTVSSIMDFGDSSTLVADTIDLVHTYNSVGQYTPTYILTDSLGCQVSYIIDTVVVGLIPYPNLTDTSVCQGNYVQYILPLGDHFQWSASQIPDYLSCDTCKTVLSTSPDTITYYVTAITNVGCVARDTITMSVDPLPQVFPGIDFHICPADTLQLHAGKGVSSATWTPDQYISDTNAVNPFIWPPDTTIYRVTAANALGCSISRIVKIYPIKKVDANLQVHDTTVCAGATVPLNVTVNAASVLDTSFYWSPPSYLNSTRIQQPLATAPPGNYTYTVIVSSTSCVSDTDTVHVVVSAKPDINAGENQTVAVGTTVQLYAESHANVNYFWTPTEDSLTCTDCRRPYITVHKSQTVYVNAVNDQGCSVEDSVLLTVVGCDSKMIFVPNTFTPNNDGVNDKLFVRGGGLAGIEYFRVFDRWGRVMFETKDLNEGWNGYTNGMPADINTYVYVLKAVCSSGSTVEMSGNVTLLR